MNRYYKTLGLQEGATLSQIKTAYRKLVKLYHPDISTVPNAEEKFIEVQKAYDMLTDHLTGLKSNTNYSKKYTKSKKEDSKEKRSEKRAAHYAKMKYKKFESEQRVYDKMKRSLILRVFSIVFVLLGVIVLLLIFLSPIFMIIDTANYAGLFVYIVILPIGYVLGELVWSFGKEMLFLFR